MTVAETVVLAEIYVPSLAILAEIVHVPVPSVIVTTPVLETTVQAVEDPAEYVTVPDPADGDAVTANEESP